MEGVGMNLRPLLRRERQSEVSIREGCRLRTKVSEVEREFKSVSLGGLNGYTSEK